MASLTPRKCNHKVSEFVKIAEPRNHDGAVELAQARHKLGISSIIELREAQLNQTQAEIAQAGARYDYQAELAVLAFQSGQIR
jgi:outer membrane protein